MLINITQPKARFNLHIVGMFPFAFHPFWSVNRFPKVIRHEETHLTQQTKLTIPIFLILYIIYSLFGMIKYGLKKTKTIYTNNYGMGLKTELAKWYAYNPLEREAFLRENKTNFERSFPNHRVTAFSHLSKNFNLAL